MAQAQVKQFPGYGVVYPDGKTGVKVVQTFTGGPSKIFNPDGSTSYTVPPPTIHELYGGGFAYASGSPVTNREHLEMLPSGMRGRALEWFDGHGKLSEVAKEDVPPLNLDEKQRPEPVYVLSSELSVEKDEVMKDLDKTVQGAMQGVNVVMEKLNQDGLFATMEAIRKNVSAMMDTIKDQGKQIADLKKRPPAPRRMARSEAKHGKQSETMKARWANPEFKAKMIAKNPALKKKVNDGKDTTETS